MHIDKNAEQGYDVLSNCCVFATISDAIFKWGMDRNITAEGGATSHSQMKKLAEEVEELKEALEEGDLKNIKLEVGDVYVVLHTVCRLAGIDLLECVRLAYSKIENRKGKMIDGIFVKEEDLGV